MSDDKKNQGGQIHKGGIPNRSQHYNMIAKHFPLALKTLVDVMENSKHDSVRVSAANKIVDKVLPNLMAQEFKDEDGNTVPFTVVVKGLLNNATETTGTK
jgi:hypothetical protein